MLGHLSVDELCREPPTGGSGNFTLNAAGPAENYTPQTWTWNDVRLRPKTAGPVNSFVVAGLALVHQRAKPCSKKVAREASAFGRGIMLQLELLYLGADGLPRLLGFGHHLRKLLGRHRMAALQRGEGASAGDGDHKLAGIVARSTLRPPAQFLRNTCTRARGSGKVAARPAVGSTV